jgi:hypothetical protein
LSEKNHWHKIGEQRTVNKQKLNICQQSLSL